MGAIHQESIHMRLDRGFLFASISACFLAASLTSCGEERAPANGASRATSAPNASGSDVDAADVEIPEAGNLPSDFPSDVPIFPGAAPQHSLSIMGDSMMVTFAADASSRDVYDFYETHLTMRGWKISKDSDGDHHVSADKDTRSISVMIIATGASSDIAISITGI